MDGGQKGVSFGVHPTAPDGLYHDLGGRYIFRYGVVSWKWFARSAISDPLIPNWFSGISSLAPNATLLYRCTSRVTKLRYRKYL